MFSQPSFEFRGTTEGQFDVCAKKKKDASTEIQELVRAHRFAELGELVARSDKLNVGAPEVAEAFVLTPFSEDIALVQRFLDKGVSINTSFKEQGILHIAACLPNADFVRQLLELQPNINQLGPDEATALNCCARRVDRCRDEKECLRPIYRQIAEMLIDAGSDVNLPDKFRCTSLDYACKAEDAELAELLLERGAEVVKGVNEGSDAYWDALRSIGTRLLSLLLKHSKIPGRDVGINGISIMVGFAASQGWLEKVQMLVEAGASPKREDGSDALQYAAEYEQLREKTLRDLGLLRD